MVNFLLDVLYEALNFEYNEIFKNSFFFNYSVGKLNFGMNQAAICLFLLSTLM